LVSGVVAQLLEANPNLTYREVQQRLSGGSVMDFDVLVEVAGADVNTTTFFSDGAGYTVNRGDVVFHQIGGGMLDWTLNVIRPIDFQGTTTAAYLTFEAPLGESREPASEGGPISIESIIASTELDPGADSGNSKTVVKESTGMADYSRELANSDQPADRSVSPEWARAIVFELAGGQPASVVRPLVPGPRPTAAESRPGQHDLSAGDYRTDAPADSDWSRSTFRSVPREATVETWSRPLSSKPRLSATSQSGSHAWALRQGVHDSSEVEAESVAFRVADSARDEALEQMEKGAATTDWFADYSRRALSASPLLLVLALERVIARKSRRASTGSSPDAPFLPRPSHRFAARRISAG
jgi:hypothetical protein